MKKPTILFLIALSFLCSCRNEKKIDPDLPLLTLSNETGIELFAIKILMAETKSAPEHLKTYFSSGSLTENDPNQGLQTIPPGKIVLLPGISFKIDNRQAGYEIIKRVRPKIELKGLKLFLTDGNSSKDAGAIAIVQCDDEFTPLVYMRTNGINVGVTNHQLITRLDSLNRSLDLKLVGADFDWCEFEIRKTPEDWHQLAETLYKLCPDIVEQGTGDVKTLEAGLISSKRLYLWFD